MSPKGPRGPTLCLLLIVTVACLGLPRDGSDYRNFVERHLNNPKSSLGSDNSYCNQMMRRKGLRCQRSNTFIHASEEQLKSICNSQGQILEGNKTSKTMFPITICKRRRGLRRLLCRYKGKSKIRRIRVTCKKGLPVHYISSV